ncbi:MAG: tRNA (N6-isopentenyl adenosine(37)-C2)-methylthiotransferase MiaB [Pseudomonadota bacterium]
MIRRYYIKTMGCQMNVHDSQVMAAMLEHDGWQAASGPADADLIIINTCSIREKAEQKVHSLLGRLAILKQAKRSMIMAACGCVAQQKGRALLDSAPHLDLVFGTQQIARLNTLLAEVGQGRRRCELAMAHPFPQVERTTPAGIKAFVSIMQGCDNFCTYCIVPYVRGREVSRPVADVLNEVSGLLSRGINEITLLGQNVNSYGKRVLGNGSERPRFVDLLTDLARCEGRQGERLKRIRFTTSHPRDLSPQLAALFGSLEPLCEHIHLPVQSGSSRLLQLMHRGYDRDDYRQRISWLRESCPDIAITTDIIIGFPGETEDDFEQTLDLLQETGFDGAFSFKYSDRPPAKAVSFAAKVAEEIKDQRLARLQDLQAAITFSKNRALMGTTQEVLVEGASKRGGTLTGRTRCNRIVHFAGPSDLVGQLLDVHITEAHTHSLKGRLEDKPRSALRQGQARCKESLCTA